MKNIAIFASGKGTNAQIIIEYFKNHSTINVVLVVTNNPSAGVLKVAHENKIISAIINKDSLNKEEVLMKLLNAQKIDLIVLAGFLQLIPSFLLQNFPKRIINIHPALLPKHGGKGMYGIKVHEAVLANKEKETGITIHYVNEVYDDGEILLQKNVAVTPDDTPETLSVKVQQLEHEWFVKAIEGVLG